jgi:phospholipid-translocating ATPase
MLPLLAILIITMIKDGIEDYRRQQLDDGVNNSAVTRLGDWRNVNVPLYQRSLISRIFGLKGSIPSPSSTTSSSSKRQMRSKNVSKGVRKLREKEGALNTDFLYVGGAGGSMNSDTDLAYSDNNSSASLPNAGRYINSLAEEAEDEGDNNGNNELDILDSYSNIDGDSSFVNLTSASTLPSSTNGARAAGGAGGRGRSGSLAQSMATSNRTILKTGVVDYDRQSPGTAKWERTLWKKLEVGDVVLLRENDQVPADMVVLSTSDADGQCFVETKNVGFSSCAPLFQDFDWQLTNADYKKNQSLLSCFSLAGWRNKSQATTSIKSNTRDTT